MTRSESEAQKLRYVGNSPRIAVRICECVLSTVADEKNEDRDGTATDNKRQKGVQGSGNQDLPVCVPPQGRVRRAHTLGQRAARGMADGTHDTVSCGQWTWTGLAGSLVWAGMADIEWHGMGPITGVLFRLLVMFMVSVIPNGRLS